MIEWRNNEEIERDKRVARLPPFTIAETGCSGF